MADYLYYKNQTGNMPNPIQMDELTARISAIYCPAGVGLTLIPEEGVFDHTVNSKDNTV